MEAIQEFMVNNYMWIIIICIFLIFTILGYMADKSSNSKEKKDGTKKNNKLNSKKEISKTIETPNINEKEVIKVEENKDENIVSTNDISEETNKDENIKPEITTDIKIQEKPLEENKEEPSKSLDELIKENEGVDNTIPIEEVKEENIKEDIKVLPENNPLEKTEEVVESIPDDVVITNSWEPELKEETKDINIEPVDIEKNSK